MSKNPRKQTHDEWDLEHPEEVPNQTRSTRTVVSVAFSRSDFSQVARYAEQEGMKVSEFIRDTVLRRIGVEPTYVSVTAGLGSTIYAPRLSPATAVRFGAGIQTGGERVA